MSSSNDVMKACGLSTCIDGRLDKRPIVKGITWHLKDEQPDGFESIHTPFHFTMAGGNDPYGLFHGLRTLHHKARLHNQVLAVDRVFFTSHNDCAHATVDRAFPEEGIAVPVTKQVRKFMRLFLCLRGRLPFLSDRNPALYHARIHIPGSSVVTVTRLDGRLPACSWENVAPFKEDDPDDIREILADLGFSTAATNFAT